MQPKTFHGGHPAQKSFIHRVKPSLQSFLHTANLKYKSRIGEVTVCGRSIDSPYSNSNRKCNHKFDWILHMILPPVRCCLMIPTLPLLKDTLPAMRAAPQSRIGQARRGMMFNAQASSHQTQDVHRKPNICTQKMRRPL